MVFKRKFAIILMVLLPRALALSGKKIQQSETAAVFSLHVIFVRILVTSAYFHLVPQASIISTKSHVFADNNSILCKTVKRTALDLQMS